MYVSVLMVLLTMYSLVFVSFSDGTITITGNIAELSNGEKIEIYGTNRSSISCYITKECKIPSKFSGPFVGKPANFRVEHTFLNLTIGSVPVAVFKWNPSTSGSDMDNLKGFQLIISPALGNEFSKKLCRIFDLRNNTFVADDHKLEFKVTFPGLKTGDENDPYKARLSALPVDDAVYVDEQFTLPDVKVPLAVDWTSEVSYQIQALEDVFNLTVNFTLAPTPFGFRKYYIQLAQESDRDQTHPNWVAECSVDLTKPVRCQDSEEPLNIVLEDARWAAVSFRDVERGQYDEDKFRILIQPEDPDRELCFVYQPSGQRKQRDCKRTEEWFTIDKHQESTTGPDVKQTPTPTPTPNSTYTQPSVGVYHQNPSQGLQTWTVATLIFGAVGAVILVGVFFIYLRRRKSKSGFTLRKRTVYILSAYDHPCHVTAVQKLATYLEEHCHCVIYYQGWFAEEIRRHGVFQWIAAHIDKADYTVVITSEAAFKIFNGTNNDIKYTAEHHGPETDSVSFALTHVRAKMSNADFFERIIMTYFSYTEEKFLLPFNPGLKYKIPEHLPKLLCNIHKMEYDEMNDSIKRFPRMGQLKRSSQGRAVLEAVTNAAQYQLKCPDWFSKLYMIQGNDPIPKASAEDEEQTPIDSISKRVAYDAIDFIRPPQKTAQRMLTSERTPTVMTNDGVFLSPSKFATYDSEEFKHQTSFPDMDSASCFLPPESTYTMDTEGVNQHLGHICQDSLNPRSSGVCDQDESNQHLSPARDQSRQTRGGCWVEKESEVETPIKHENGFQDHCYCNVPSDLLIAPESIAYSDACTTDVEHQLLDLNMIFTHL